MENDSKWYGEKWAGNETVTRFKDMDSMIQSFLETKSELGRVTGKMGKMAELPEPDNIESIRGLASKIGLPEKPSGYGLNDDDHIGKAFIEAGILPVQAKKIIGEVKNLIDNAKAEKVKKLEEAKARLKEKWGDKAGEYEEKIARATSDEKIRRIYEVLSAEDPELAVEAIMPMAPKYSINPGNLNPAEINENSAKAILEALKEEYKEALKAGKSHWFGSPNKEQGEYLSKLYSSIKQ
ncbi:MAG: hypothetical protein ABIN58_10350 [candidate division WOR-3 bacterium]